MNSAIAPTTTVLRMTRSRSYRRYFKIAIPQATGMPTARVNDIAINMRLPIRLFSPVAIAATMFAVSSIRKATATNRIYRICCRISDDAPR